MSNPSLIDLPVFFTGLFKSVILDVSSWSDVSPVETSKDIQTLTRRFETEGFPFVTSALPTLGKAMLSAFQSGRFTVPSSPTWRKGAGTLPAFLQGLFKRVFHSDGTLLSDPNVNSVWGIQQICFLLYKYELPYSDRLVQSKIEDLKQVNESLPKTLSDLDVNYEDMSILSLAQRIITDMLDGVDLKQISPKHGPGSTAIGPLSSVEKFAQIYWDTLPNGYGNVYNRTFTYDVRENWTMDPACPLPRGGGRLDPNRMSTLHCVPKDSRGPRTISAEHPTLMWIQQGQRQLLERAAFAFSHGHINFKDQSVNANLALANSFSGRMATLDMKDASDRVSLLLFDLLFPEHVRTLLRASRSTHCRIKETNETIQLYKFAPMGSSTCFPVESIVFWSLTVAVLIQDLGYDEADAMNDVYVFGDDLICPADAAEKVMQRLESFALRFNKNKCFTQGPFRESCGCDAFLGEDVTPIRIKKVVPQRKCQAENIKAWVDYSNAFAKEWMWRTSNYISDYLENLLGRPMVACYGEIGALSKWTFSQSRPSGESYPDTSSSNMKREIWRDVSRLFPTLFAVPFTLYLFRHFIPETPYFGGRRIKTWTMKSKRTTVRGDELDRYLLLDWLSQRSDDLTDPLRLDQGVYEANRVERVANYIQYDWVYMT